ncbi:OsmC family peroxiredoxin [Sanguibacter antarcticus]|uniref:Osmotically inducible protein OsmC n=1 Tax=Sanguibacter antarcticus TaxID=372484 RepID=A0A2A9E958_9MICO|nr:OsmC family peroxiredoxin [Sanguibacter antarcticus]PFG35216.1 osmotically inducible protein OsmC [Sanguibacter antarcticus]
MAIRTARTAWNGTLTEGGGQVELTSSKVGTYDVSFPKRAADDAGGTTSPEELIAAAHSSCYAMQLSALVGEAGGTPVALDVTADVTLAPDPAGGFQISGIALRVRGEVEGLDEAGFLKAAQDAKATCPVSKALTGTTITLDAALES